MRTQTQETQANTTPRKALEILREGNRRFMRNHKVERDLLGQAQETYEGQYPFATILSCIDSRTSAEIIFDQGLGDIFSIRIAGNVVNTDVLGSMEFGCAIAGSKLIVVLGHTRCGAVKGACDHVEFGNLTELLSKLQPAVYEERSVTDPSERNGSNKAFVDEVTRLHVFRGVKAVVERSFVLEQLVERGEIGIIGAVHHLGSGEVEFFEDTAVFGAEDVRRLRGLPV